MQFYKSIEKLKEEVEIFLEIGLPLTLNKFTKDILEYNHIKNLRLIENKNSTIIQVEKPWLNLNILNLNTIWKYNKFIYIINVISIVYYKIIQNSKYIVLLFNTIIIIKNNMSCFGATIKNEIFIDFTIK